MTMLLWGVGSVALLAWSSAAVHSLLLLRHVAPPRRAVSLLWQGWRYYDASTFTEAARPLHRRFLASVAVFVLALAALVPIAALSAR